MNRRSLDLVERPLPLLVLALAAMSALSTPRVAASGWLDYHRYSDNQDAQPYQSLMEPSASPGYYLNKPIFSYVGCFNDRRELRDVGDKDYTFITKFNKSLPTVELCVLLCAQDGYSIAGIQALLVPFGLQIKII